MRRVLLAWLLLSGRTASSVRLVPNVNQCQVASGVDVWGYARGCCYFVTTATVLWAELAAHCELVVPGAVPAILPDVAVAQEALAYNNAQMVGAAHGWMRLSGHQNPPNSAVANDDFHWLLPDGTQLPIPVNEMIARRNGDARKANEFYLWASTDELWVVDATDWAAPVLCQKRVSSLAYTRHAASRGQGAELGTNATVASVYACAYKCHKHFACLAFSYQAPTADCQLHYTTLLDYKLSLAEDADSVLFEVAN